MISSLHGLYDDRIYWKEAISLKHNGFEVIHIAVGQEELDFISAHGIRLIQVKKKMYFTNPYLDIIYRKLHRNPDIYKRLLHVMDQVKADVYHFHDVQINKIGKQIAQLGHRPKVIYDVHEDYYEQIIAYHPYKIISWIVSVYAARVRRLERRSCRHYDAVIAAVPHISENFRKYVDPDKLHVLYNYTSLKPDKYPNYEDKPYDAIYSGLMNKTRCGIEIIEAASMIRKEIPNIKIIIVGLVPNLRYLKKMKKRIAQLGIEQNVILKGSVPYNEMETLLLQSRIGLGIFMPVKVFYFGIQVKTFEYMVCGLPVVCSNFGNIHKIISDCNAGISVDPRSPEELATAIVKILTNRKLYHTFSKNGIRSVVKEYNWDSEEKKLIAIYQKLFHDDHF